MGDATRLLAAQDPQAVLRAVLDQLPVGVVVAEVPSGRLVLGNDQVAQIFRHPFIAADTLEEYAGYQGFHRDGRPMAGEEWPLARTVATGEVIEAEEVVFRRGDASFGVLRISSVPVFDERGEPLAAVVIFEDVSDEVRRREHQALLAEAGAALSASLDPARVVETVGDLLVPRVADYWALDLLQDDGTLERVGAGHADPEQVDLGFRIADRHHIDPATPVGRGAALRTLRPQLIERVDDDFLAAIASDEAHLRAMQAVGLHSAVYLPLVARGRATGAMLLGVTMEGRRSFTRADVDPLMEVTSRCALALDNARLYTREREAAELLQRSLLPQALPVLEAGRACVRYLPGATGTDVGGDWYDVLPLAGGRVALAVGDVVGRGVRAAAVMGQLRSALRACAMHGGIPGEVVAQLNAVEHTHLRPQLATLVFAIHDRARGLVAYTAAGHLPPLVRRAGGEVETLPPRQGMALGVEAGADYATAVTALGRGDLVVLYTDGLVERRTGTLEEGVDRLRAALAEGPPELPTLCDQLITACAPSGEDDVALLAYECG
ncbi:MAG TPA: SpoIIE family protein phosphatase [Solirubrobacteraceae bacterium]|nr:SpoIIE family protein phosphatase [Solirubrobacteraceae bacterium]